MPHAFYSVLLAAGLVLLAFAALHDLGFRTIPNHVPVTLFAVGLVMRFEQGNLPAGLLCGVMTFMMTYAFWRFGWIGGADAKLLSAAATFVPPLMLPQMIIATSLSGGVLACVYLFGSYLAPLGPISPAPRARLLTRIKLCELRRLRRRGPLPYGAAIAVGSWLVVASA